MNAFLILVSLITMTAGQLLLKHALNRLELEKTDRRRKQAWWIFAGSIGSMTISFFLSVGLLQKMDLSYFYPFQGLTVIMIAFSSAFFFKERLSLPLISGILLITVGVVLVSMS